MDAIRIFFTGGEKMTTEEGKRHLHMVIYHQDSIYCPFSWLTTKPVLFYNLYDLGTKVSVDIIIIQVVGENV